MQITTIIVGPFAVNCYLLVCPQTKEAVIIDPGDDAERLVNTLHEQRIQTIRALITHAHLDHIGGLSDLASEFAVDISLHPADHSLYQRLPDQGFRFGRHFQKPPTVTHLLHEGDWVSLGKTALRVIHTPGHTPGGICFLAEKDKILFTGDTLFAGSIGRTDLEGGNESTLLHSIHSKLLSLPDDMVVYPGHGPETTIGGERRSNPFLQSA